jgi:hypothetical protein
VNAFEVDIEGCDEISESLGNRTLMKSSFGWKLNFSEWVHKYSVEPYSRPDLGVPMIPTKMLAMSGV